MLRLMLAASHIQILPNYSSEVHIYILSLDKTQ